MDEKRLHLIQKILNVKHEGTLDELLKEIDGIEAFYQSRAEYLNRLPSGDERLTEYHEMQVRNRRFDEVDTD
jgi:hypothetical protein